MADTTQTTDTLAQRLREAAAPIVDEIHLYPPSVGEDDDEMVPVRLADIKRLRDALRRSEGLTS